MDETFHAGSMLKPWQTILASLSKANIAAATQGLNDMAFAYRTEAPLVIGEHRTIRSPSYIKGRFLVEKAKSGPLSNMRAISGSITSERFTGFEEDYGEGPANQNRRSSRSIGANARGGDMEGKAKQSNRLIGDMPKIDDFASIKGAQNQRMAAMISMIARHPSVAPNGVFIIHGTGLVSGIYRIKPGAQAKIKASGKKAKGNAMSWYTYAPPIQRIQTFKAKDMPRKRIDWAHIALEHVSKRADAIMVNAFSKAYKK